tara:strand:+ start:463 stop:894 length:432 start_codon:yes stop_codon:yes gene_type:complete
MIEQVTHNNKLLSLIIRVNYKSDGIEFFTPGNFSQQIGYMNRKRNHVIPPHTHNIVKREVNLTQEVLFIKSGKIRVDYYDQDKKYLESRILYKGDVVLLAGGGHGFEMLEDSEMIEVKQGPYAGDMDKKVFEPVKKDELKINK